MKQYEDILIQSFLNKDELEQLKTIFDNAKGRYLDSLTLDPFSNDTTTAELKYALIPYKDYKNLLIQQGKHLLETGYYNQGAYKIAEVLSLKMTVKHFEYGKHFEDDKQSRHIFKVTLKKDGKQYTFKFGQSIAEDNNEPTLYSVLACLQKYDVGSFEDFCGEFGYDNDSRTAERIYKAVQREYRNMERLFSSEELEILQEIN